MQACLRGQYVVQRERSVVTAETTVTHGRDRDRNRHQDRHAVTVKAERVVAKRPTYKQDWPAYNLAQVNEKHSFQVLLQISARASRTRPQEKGRPRVSLRDMVFSAVFKVYSTVSGRRFMCDLNDARRKVTSARPAL